MKILTLKALVTTLNPPAVTDIDYRGFRNYVFFYPDKTLASNGHTAIKVPDGVVHLEEPVCIHADELKSFLKAFRKADEDREVFLVKRSDREREWVIECGATSQVFEPSVPTLGYARVAEAVDKAMEESRLAQEGQVFNWEYMARIEKSVAMAAGIKVPPHGLTYKFYKDFKCIISAEAPTGVVQGVVMGIRM